VPCEGNAVGARARVLPYNAGRRDTQWRTRARITQTNLTTSSVQFSST
jgi:hypothetical protein